MQATDIRGVQTPPAPTLPTALLVEDEALVAVLAEEDLRDLGFEPIWVTSAAAALARLAEGPALALAVIDVGLPDRRGDDLAQAIRRDHPDLGIIVATGHETGALTARFRDDRRTVILGKPYLAADLARCARAVISGEHRTADPFRSEIIPNREENQARPWRVT